MMNKQAQLQIDQINMRGLVVEVDEETELEDFEGSHLRHMQILKYFDKVRELLPEAAPDQGNENSPYIYRFYMTLGIRSLSDEDAGHPDQNAVSPMLIIQADYVIQYLSERKLSEKDCLDFAEYEVYLHLWPYFREVVQSSCSRLGIECLTVPAYPE
ncbi:hypothetical protein [Vibrio quintilis]|uniref:Uncharacterized protein n=1 Tax=Vibrio quintilis TaxID=1117707 RepID=A0A1M7YW36_9VIBR|nr:hypothetical protein [Vibrio quintilis]SHO56821.1 hypothetical protein VQ7734_02590 [Vibrio quintilis]